MGPESWQARAALRLRSPRHQAAPVQTVHCAQVLRLPRRRAQTLVVGHSQVVAEPDQSAASSDWCHLGCAAVSWSARGAAQPPHNAQPRWHGLASDRLPVQVPRGDHHSALAFPSPLQSSRNCETKTNHNDYFLSFPSSADVAWTLDPVPHSRLSTKQSIVSQLANACFDVRSPSPLLVPASPSGPQPNMGDSAGTAKRLQREAGSLGWLSESAVQPKKQRLIEGVPSG